MEVLKQKLIWIVPLTMAFAFFSLLFYQGAESVSNQPSEDWSRGIEIGKSNSKTLPTLYKTEDGKYQMTIFNEGILTKKTFSKEFTLENESTMEVPFTKWDPYYAFNNTLIYLLDNEIIDHNSGDVLANANSMFVKEGHIYYIQETSLFSLDPSSLETKELGTLPEGYEEYKITHHNDILTVIADSTVANKLNFAMYQLQNGNLKKVQEQSIKVSANESIVEVAYAATDKRIGLAMKSFVESAGKDPYRLYVSEFQSSDDTISPRLVNPIDPNTGARIDEIGEVTTSYLNDQLSLAFYGVGFSKVDYQTNYAPNIYELNIVDDDNITAKRRSNTYRLSTKPELVNDHLVMWMDTNIPNTLYVSSSQPQVIEQAAGYTKTDMLLALGVTMSMLTKAFPFLILAMKWMVWPLLFFVLLFFFYRKSIDHDYNWVLYSAIGIYLLGAFVQSGTIFTQKLNATAPAYIAFPGNSIVIILVAGLIAYGCMQFIHRSTSAGYKVVYFVFVHILLLSLTVGPYVF